MGHYIKARSIRCHYNFDPNCSQCHGNKDWRDKFGLPCQCGLENMTFEELPDELLAVEVNPLPDGGAQVHMKVVKPETN